MGWQLGPLGWLHALVEESCCWWQGARRLGAAMTEAGGGVPSRRCRDSAPPNPLGRLRVDSGAVPDPIPRPNPSPIMVWPATRPWARGRCDGGVELN